MPLNFSFAPGVLILLVLASWVRPVTSSAQTSVPIPQVIYDNSGSAGTNFFPLMQEYGDEIILDVHPLGTLWTLTDFFLEYFGDFTADGDETGRVRIYLNDGEPPNYAPKTLLYDSQEFPIEPGFHTKVFTAFNALLPDDGTFPEEGKWSRLTWTVQFGGMRGVTNDQAGLLLRPTPERGHSFKDLWIKTPNGWTLSQIPPANPNFPVDPVTNPDPIENFGALFQGVATPIPPAPKLSIRQRNDNLVIEWNGSAQLQASDTVNGPYSDVVSAFSPYTIRVLGNTAQMKFWRLDTSRAPAPPRLNIRRVNNNLVIEWNGTARLQVCTSSNGSYADVLGATSPYTVALDGTSAPTRFWRLMN